MLAGDCTAAGTDWKRTRLRGTGRRKPAGSGLAPSGAGNANFNRGVKIGKATDAKEVWPGANPVMPTRTCAAGYHGHQISWPAAIARPAKCRTSGWLGRLARQIRPIRSSPRRRAVPSTWQLSNLGAKAQLWVGTRRKSRIRRTISDQRSYSWRQNGARRPGRWRRCRDIKPHCLRDRHG